MLVRDGDVDQLGILFERHHARLYAFCRRLTGDPDAAGDLVQETFFRTLEYRESYRDRGAFRAWMYRMARNACIDHLGRSGRETPGEDQALALASTEPLPAERAERREELRLLERALGRLSPEKRETLLLARFGSMSYAEIADTLGCTVSAVKVRVHRAVRELRDHYTRAATEVAP